MGVRPEALRKITISLPAELVDFADKLAEVENALRYNLGLSR